jgi:hypothetical protein
MANSLSPSSRAAILEVARQAEDELAHQDGAQRIGEWRQDQRQIGVGEAEAGDQRPQRHDQAPIGTISRISISMKIARLPVISIFANA